MSRRVNIYIGAETLRLQYQKDLSGVGYRQPLALSGRCMSNSLRLLQNPSQNWYIAIADNVEYFMVTGSSHTWPSSEESLKNLIESLINLGP